jgi:hypothetical protein
LWDINPHIPKSALKLKRTSSVLGRFIHGNGASRKPLTEGWVGARACKRAVEERKIAYSSRQLKGFFGRPSSNIVTMVQQFSLISYSIDRNELKFAGEFYVMKKVSNLIESS